MQIRTRLTLQFILAGAIILIIASITIYFFSVNFRRNDFQGRLKKNALVTANLFFVQYEVDAERFLRYDKDNPVSLHDEKILVLNSKRDTIYNSDTSGIINASIQDVQQIESGFNYTAVNKDYEIIGTRYFTNYDSFVIFSAALDIEGLEHLRQLEILLILVTMVCLLLFFVVGWFSTAKAIKPLSDVVKKVEDITASSLNIRLNAGSSNDEIDRLSRTFNRMMERLEKSFASQKSFISNASHEMRTPLTSINGQLEVLIMKNRTEEEYKLGVDSVLNDIKSLIHLLNRLLLLARTNTGIPLSHTEIIRADEVLWQVKEDLKRFNPDYNLIIEMDESINDEEQMKVTGDEQLLKLAFSNVIDNACKYSADKSVHVNIYPSGNYVKIEFIDKGIGISEEGLKKAFDPFFRDNNTFPATGHGIGLALTKQIITIHNGSIEISSQPGKGTTVLINLLLEKSVVQQL
ncbi:MAG: HAMP domain-containing sensor histidine kinase [Bacteroidales bacterium]